jgi:hypothetical protein
MLLQLSLVVWASKPTENGFAWSIWVSKPRMKFEATHGVTGKLTSRQSILVRGSRPSDAWISTWTIICP